MLSGLTGALTGPGAGTTGPACVEGLRLYVRSHQTPRAASKGKKDQSYSCLTMEQEPSESRH